MMKYIRTKHGLILETSKRLDSKECYQGLLRFAKDNKKGGKQITIVAKNIVAQADTIPELCDGFYVDVDNHPFAESEVFTDVEKAIESARDWQAYSNRKYLCYDIKVYGFVKTNKGLIFATTVDFGKEGIGEYYGR